MAADLENEKKCGLGATLLAAALPYLAAFSFSYEAQAAQVRGPNEGHAISLKDSFDLSQQALPQIAAERLPDGRELSRDIDLKSLPLLRLGDAGEWVKYLQEKLNQAGAKLTPDGKFGSLTERAVNEFQNLNKLGQDGVIGPKSWEKLFESSLKSGDAPTIQLNINLSSNQDLRALLRWHEGVRSDLYKCTAGKCTIGVGHNLDAKGSREEIAFYSNNRASLAQIEKWLTQDIEEAQSDLESAFGKEAWYQNLSNNRKCALLDLCFNLGIGQKGESGLLEFQKMIGCLKSGNFVAASEQLLKSRYADQVGARADRIAAIIATDKMPRIDDRFYRSAPR